MDGWAEGVQTGEGEVNGDGDGDEMEGLNGIRSPSGRLSTC